MNNKISTQRNQGKNKRAISAVLLLAVGFSMVTPSVMAQNNWSESQWHQPS